MQASVNFKSCWALESFLGIKTLLLTCQEQQDSTKFVEVGVEFPLAECDDSQDEADDSKEQRKNDHGLARSNPSCKK